VPQVKPGKDPWLEKPVFIVAAPRSGRGLDRRCYCRRALSGLRPTSSTTIQLII